jgi:diguanylate cyclase (GGDEF)-like protein/PAS domain S-box-containing protein
MVDVLSSEQLAALYQEAPCGFLVTTLDGQIVGANRTFGDWVSRDESCILGSNIREFLPAASKLFFDTHYTALLQAGRVVDVAMEVERRANSPMPVLVTSRVVHLEASRTSIVHSTFFDASERRQAERALVVAKRRADALADVVHSSPHAILTASYEFEIKTCNEASEKLLNNPCDLIEGSSLKQHLAESTLATIIECLESNRALEEQITLLNGVVCRMSAYPMLDGVAIYLADITREHDIQNALREAHDRFTLATQATTDGLWDWNCETGLVYLSGRARSMLGHSSVALEVPLKQLLRGIHPKDFASLRKGGIGVNAHGERFESEWRIRHLDGSWRWVQSRALALSDDQHRIRRMVGSLTDVTDRKTEDVLTKLHTRLSLLEQLEWRLAADARFQQPCALLFIDIDGFKKVNDGLGHAAGDVLIFETAQRLRSTAADKSSSLTARLGGDEFAILLQEASGAEEACLFANRLLEALQEPLLISGQQVSVSASIGIAVNRPFSGTAEELLRNADLAMYRAKALGKGQSVFFTDEMHQAARTRLVLEADLRQAVAAGSLELYYQPKLDLRSKEIVGYEALGRWEHPVHGMVPPDIFIAIAEESNLIRDIGRWTIREAMRQLALWKRSGLAYEQTSVSINLSPKQFEDTGLIDMIAESLLEYDLTPSTVHFEVTEGVLISDGDMALAVLQSLKGLGVGLELDDFGKGYSSLSYLHRYPFDVLKVDRAFVSGLGEQEDADAIVHTIIALAHTLGLKVIAEGIETEQQLAILQTLGCELGQGYLFSKAIPPSEIAELHALSLAY